MAENIIQFQSGREAFIAGRKRDARRSADWLEGYDMERDAMNREFYRHQPAPKAATW